MIKKLNKNGQLILNIKARPGADKTKVKEVMSDNTLKIDVAAPPEDGKANAELIAYLAKNLQVKRQSIKVISGQGARYKLIKINGK